MASRFSFVVTTGFNDLVLKTLLQQKVKSKVEKEAKTTLTLNTHK